MPQSSLPIAAAAMASAPGWLAASERQTLNRVFGGARPVRTYLIGYPRKISVVWVFDSVIVCGDTSRGQGEAHAHPPLHRGNHSRPATGHLLPQLIAVRAGPALPAARPPVATATRRQGRVITDSPYEPRVRILCGRCSNRR